MTINVYCTQVINSEPIITNSITFASNHYLSTGVIVGVIFGSLLVGCLIMIMLFYLYPSLLVSAGYEKKYYLSEMELTEDKDKQGPFELVRISVDVSVQNSLHEPEEKGIVDLIDAEKLPVFHMIRPASIEDDECPTLMDHELPRTSIEHSRDGLFKEQLRIANLKKDITYRMQLLFKNSYDMNDRFKQRKERINELSDLEEKRLRDVRKNEFNLSRDLNLLMDDILEVSNSVGLQMSKRIVKEKNELSLRLKVEEKAREVRLRSHDVQKREILANGKLLIDLFWAAEEEVIANLTQQKIELVHHIVEEYESKMQDVISKKQRFMQLRSNNLISINSLLNDSESKVDDYSKEERALTMTSEKDRITLLEVLKQEKSYLRAAILINDDHYNLSLKLDQEDLISTVMNDIKTIDKLKVKAIDGLRRMQGEELELINILKKNEVVIDDLDKKEALVIQAHNEEMEKFVAKLKKQEVLIKSMSQSNKERLQKYRAKEQIRIEQLNVEEQTRSKQELVDQLKRRKQEDGDRVNWQKQQRVRLIMEEEEHIEQPNNQKKNDIEDAKLPKDTRRELKKDADDSSNRLTKEEEVNFKDYIGGVKKLEQFSKDLQYHKDEVANNSLRPVENNRIPNEDSIENLVEVELGLVLTDLMYNPLLSSEGDDDEIAFTQESLDHAAEVVTDDRIDGIEEGFASERGFAFPLGEDGDAKHRALPEDNHDDKIPQFLASKDTALSLRDDQPDEKESFANAHVQFALIEGRGVSKDNRDKISVKSIEVKSKNSLSQQLNDSSPELLAVEAELRKVDLKSDKSYKNKQQQPYSVSQLRGIGLSFTSLRAGLRSIHPLDADSYFDSSDAKEPKSLHLISKKPTASPKGSYILDNYFGEYSAVTSPAEFTKQQNTSRAVTAPELTLKRKPSIDSTDHSFNQFLQNYDGLMFRNQPERTWGESKSAVSLSCFEPFGDSTMDKRPAGKTMNLYRPWSAEIEGGTITTTTSKSKSTVTASKMLTSITENISTADDDCVSIDLSVSSNVSASSNRSATSPKKKRNKLVVIHKSSDQDNSILPPDVLPTTADSSQQIKLKSPVARIFPKSSVIGGIGDKCL